VDAGLEALRAAGHPLIDIRLDDASWVGAEFFRWEFAAAVAGIGLGVAPFAEPDVAESGHHTRTLLGVHERAGRLPEAAPDASRGPLRAWRAGEGEGGEDLAALLRGHLARIPERGYLHLGAFVAPTERRSELLRALQARLRDGTGVATTAGYGPRFLHTTGQLHKGGPPIGCFIQLTAGHPVDLEIPGRDETFGLLLEAQAAGERTALADRGLLVLRIDLGHDVEAGLAELGAVLEDALA
jgi:hypothetical protein